MSHNENGDTKPRGKLCRRGALIEWTGWDRKHVAYLVAVKRLRTMRLRPNDKLYYYVESAQDIMDGRG